MDKPTEATAAQATLKLAWWMWVVIWSLPTVPAAWHWYATQGKGVPDEARFLGVLVAFTLPAVLLLAVFIGLRLREMKRPSPIAPLHGHAPGDALATASIARWDKAEATNERLGHEIREERANTARLLLQVDELTKKLAAAGDDAKRTLGAFDRVVELQDETRRRLSPAVATIRKVEGILANDGSYQAIEAKDRPILAAMLGLSPPQRIERALAVLQAYFADPIASKESHLLQALRDFKPPKPLPPITMDGIKLLGGHSDAPPPKGDDS